MHRSIWTLLILPLAACARETVDGRLVAGDLGAAERTAIEQQLIFELTALNERAKWPIYMELRGGDRPVAEVNLLHRMPFAWPGVTTTEICESCAQGTTTANPGLLLGGSFAPEVAYDHTWQGSELAMSTAFEMQGLPSSWLSGQAGSSADLPQIDRALIHVEHHSEQVQQSPHPDTQQDEVRRTATKRFSIVLPDTVIRMGHTDVGEVTLDSTTGEFETVEYSATFDEMRDLPVEASFAIDSAGVIAGAIWLGDKELGVIGGNALEVPPLRIEWHSLPVTPSDDVCVPACATRTCGLDTVCGKSCGECGSSNDCSPDGQCLQSCVPDCSGRVCGDDGCGGICGSCSAGPGESVSCMGGQCVES